MRRQMNSRLMLIRVNYRLIMEATGMGRYSGQLPMPLTLFSEVAILNTFSFGKPLKFIS